MSYSPDGEWLAGGTLPSQHHRSYSDYYGSTGAADPATHKIYIWDISNDGQFATALDGGREPLIDIHVRRLSHVAGFASIIIFSGIRMPLGLRQRLTKVLCLFGIVPLQSGGVHLLAALKKRMRM
jgi:hypothetical protein